MSVRPHPTKHRKYKGETWWIIDTGRGANRSQMPFNGSYVDACAIEARARSVAVGVTAVVSPTPRIKEMIIPFLEWYENEVAASTLEDINDTISIYLVPHFGLLRPDQLTVGIFDEFKGALLDKGLKPVTINKHLNYISSFLRWAVAHGHCPPLPFKIPKFAKKKTEAPPARPLTQRQLDAIYKHIHPDIRLLFLLMSDQTLRQSEAMNLAVEDVDENRKILMVLGKGNKYRRVPYLSKRFAKELNKVLDVRLEGPLVINKRTGKPYVTIRTALNTAAKKAGLSRNINHHLLRHTGATLCAEKEMDAHALQKILGHESIETTNKIYTNVSIDFVGEQARRIREL